MHVPSKKYTRKEFTKLTTLSLASIPLLSFQDEFMANSSTTPPLNINLFSKHLQFLDYNDMSAAASEMGFDGLDLTVRKKGHVLPENVIEDLPKAVSAMKKHGLTPTMITTNVWDAKNTINQNVLKTASRLGFSHYRTNWLTYPEDCESFRFFSLQNQLANISRR